MQRGESILQESEKSFRQEKNANLQKINENGDNNVNGDKNVEEEKVYDALQLGQPFPFTNDIVDYGWILIFLTAGLGITFLVLQSLQPLPWLDLNYDPRWVFQLSDQTTYNYDALKAAKTQLLYA